MNIVVVPRVMLRYLLCVIAALLAMDAMLLVMKFGYAQDTIYGLTYLFDVNTEQNIPTLFSTFDLLLASGLLLLIFSEARQHARRDANYWLGLAGIFAFLATDEFCSLHEKFNKPLQLLWHTTGALTYAWVIPYAGLVAVFGLAYFGFWWRLPVRSRMLLALSASLYVVGALGLELIGAELDSIFGMGQSLAAGIENLIEEGMEMSGVALFVFSLLEILKRRSITIQFGAATVPVTSHRDELLSYVLDVDADHKADDKDHVPEVA